MKILVIVIVIVFVMVFVLLHSSHYQATTSPVEVEIQICPDDVDRLEDNVLAG